MWSSCHHMASLDRKMFWGNLTLAARLVFFFMQCHLCMWTVIDYLLCCSSCKLAGCSSCNMFPHHRLFFFLYFLSVFAQAVPCLHRPSLFFMYLCIVRKSVARKEKKNLLLCLGRQQRLFWLRFCSRTV